VPLAGSPADLARIVVGYDEPTRRDLVPKVPVGVELPFWVVAKDKPAEISPFGQPWGNPAAADELLDPALWLKHPAFLDQLVAVGPPGHGLLIPLPFREPVAANVWSRYFARQKTPTHPPAVIRISDEKPAGGDPQGNADVVGRPDSLTAVLEKVPAKVIFRRVQKVRGRVAILAGCDETTAKQLVTAAGPADPYPFWVLILDDGVAPFLASRPLPDPRPEGVTRPLTPDDLKDTVFNLDALTHRPDRVALLRAAAAAGPVRPLSVRGTDRNDNWRWLFLSGDHNTLLFAEEEPPVGESSGVPAEPLTAPCPKPLARFVENTRVPPESVVVETRVTGGQRIGVIVLDHNRKSADAPPADLRRVYPALTGRADEYPLWLFAGDPTRPFPDPRAVFSTVRAGVTLAYTPDQEPPPPLGPALLAHPDLFTELTAGVAASERLFHLARYSEKTGPRKGDWFAVFYTRPFGPDSGHLMIVEGADHPAPGRTCRTVEVPRRVNLEAFIQLAAGMEAKKGTLAGAFWKDLEALPAGHTVVWAGPAAQPDAKPIPATGEAAVKAAALDAAGGYTIGPAGPPAPGKDWVVAGEFRVRYIDRRPTPPAEVDLEWRTTGNWIVARFENHNSPQKEQTPPKYHGFKPRSPAEEYNLILRLARDVLDLGGTDGREVGWKTNPREFFQPEPGRK
jgi:hypothetical protein